MLRGCLIFVLVLGTACGDDGGPENGACPVDMSFDNASCGDQVNFTGELVDWDNDTTFCGVLDAQLEVQGGGAMDSTGPNGRFELCVPGNQAVTLLDVTPPAANSVCTNPPGMYPVPGIVVARPDVLKSGAFFSVRAFTAARRDAFFAQAGISFAPALAQVFVHVHGDSPRAVSISADHAVTFAVADRAWAPGNTGHEVFFPNVNPAGGSTMLTVEGGACGTGMIPVAAGKFTYVTVYPR